MRDRQPPQDARVRALVRAAQEASRERQARLSRRLLSRRVLSQRVLSRRAVLGGAAGSALLLALAACAPAGVARPTPAIDRSGAEKSLRWANWPDYLDTDAAGGHPSLTAFTKSTGIAVHYSEPITSNGGYYDTVSARLATGKDIGADLIVLSDAMAARLIRNGYVQKFQNAEIGNAARLLPELRQVDYDPHRRRSLPWQSSFAGICWNTAAVPGGLHSVSELWDASFAGRVGVVSEMRDAVGLIMLEQGVDIGANWGRDAFYDAIDVLTRQRSNGQLASVTGSYTDDLRNGTTVAAICWSSDIDLLNAQAGDKWTFAMPDAGGTLFSDNLQIPIGSPHRANAEKLIDYYYQPDVAAEVAAWVRTISPVAGAKEYAARVDPALAANPLVFPDTAMLAAGHAFRTLDDDEQQEYQTAFEAALLGPSR